MSDFDNIINDRLNEDDGEIFPHREMNWDKLSQRLDIFEAANPQNDFDNTINNRLNEDDGEFFPRREMNWDKLSQRLDDFEVANPLPKVVELPKPALSTAWKRWAWTSAAAALVGVSGLLIWHFNEVKTLEQRNAELAQQIKTYEAAPKNNADTAFGKVTGDKIGTAATAEKTTVGQSQISTDSANRGTQLAGISTNSNDKTSIAQKQIQQTQANTPQNKQTGAIVDTKSGNRTIETGKTGNANDAAIQKRKNSQIARMDNKKVQNALPFDKQNAPLNGQKLQLNESIVNQAPSVKTDISEANKANLAQKKPNNVPIAPKAGDENVQLDKKNLDKVETVTQVSPSPNNRDASTVTESGVTKNNDSETPKTSVGVTETPKTEVAATETPKVDSVAKNTGIVQNETKTAENPPIIVPKDKDKKWLKAILPKGFAIGLEGLYGSVLPEVPGLTPTVGKGLSAELMVTKNISLAASGDLLETQFDVGERPKRFHVKDEPDPHKPNVELHRIKGEQHSRLLSLNAKYIFGQKWWAQPSISVGHSWQKIEAYSANFVFRDITTNAETPVEVRVETEKVRNLWQAGVGVEKRIKRWTFAVSAEMQKDFSAPTDPNGKVVASNFGILRGGVKFNIF